MYTNVHFSGTILVKEVAVSTSVVVAGGVQSPRLLDVVRQTGLRRFARADAAEGWVDWTRRFILTVRRHSLTCCGR
jgi:hypothetical protein